MKIKIMDELLANKIAAGEVVQKCVSVVKELVENSIDAKAKKIKIELKESGIKEIIVSDDGRGMKKADAEIAFNRHATSKILEEIDLYNITTLGFRGEALASIASVSQVEMQTSTGKIGTEIIIDGGSLKKIQSCSARKGTIIKISNLFYNTPARLKHIKSLYSELANISSYVGKAALAHPNIKFILTNNNNLLLNTDGSNNLLKTIACVYGMELAKNMLKIEGKNNDYKIEGYISKPTITRSNRNYMITIVNGRIVKNFNLNKTINESYHTYKSDAKYPIVVLNIEVDPTLIDINIHPTKEDIKFSKMEELMTLIEKLIKKALLQENLIPKVEIETKINFDNQVQTTLNLSRKLKNEKPQKELLIEESIIQELEHQYNKKETIPELYPIGAVHGTYIVCQNEYGMYLIDQHAAQERINYEKYKEKLGNPKKEQIAMLVPITMELSHEEYIILKENLNILKNINFEIEEFGINSIIIKSHPTWLPKRYEKQAIKKIIETLITQEKQFNLEKFNEQIAINLSCKLAIKANQKVSIQEMEQLINKLRKCQNPYNCPHGRPTIIHYTKYDLERLFKRTGF